MKKQGNWYMWFVGDAHIDACIKLKCIDPHEMDRCHFYLRHLSFVTPEHLLLEALGINSETLL